MQWMRPGDKAESFILCILLCDSEKTLRLFMVEQMMLSRINMAKSSYQLDNGHATWLRSKQHHSQWEDVCMHIYCMCVYAPTCNLFMICAGACVYMCVFGSVCMCVYPGSFNQRPIVWRCGGLVSFLFLR